MALKKEPKKPLPQKIDDRLLVVVFLRGGCDVLNLVTPIAGEDRKIYEEERPNIRMEASGDNALLKLTDQFGLHPNAPGFHELFTAGHLAIVHGVGMPFDNRSHFDVQNTMELGLSAKKNISTGWITRYLDQYKIENEFAALSISSLTTLSLLGYDKAVQFTEPKRFSLLNDKNLAGMQMAALHDFYNVDYNPVSDSARNILKILDRFATLNAGADYQPAAGVDYPKGEIGNRLKAMAQVLKMGIVPSVATVDMGGWDTHKNQGANKEGTFARNVEQLSGAVHAFYSDLQAHDANGLGGRTTIVIMTEFGRRLKENANRGTDHGHGGLMMVIGPKVNGNKIYGRWPGLKTEQLYDRADLAATTDYRQVLHEVLEGPERRLVSAEIFPEFKINPRLGLFGAQAAAKV